jgi:hypothetical protein
MLGVQWRKVTVLKGILLRCDSNAFARRSIKYDAAEVREGAK